MHKLQIWEGRKGDTATKFRELESRWKAYLRKQLRELAVGKTEEQPNTDERFLRSPRKSQAQES